MPRTPLSQSQIQTLLAELPTWSLVSSKIHKSCQFSTFAQAFAFMTETAFLSESLDHHPEWSNVYNRVEISLTTHDAGGITQLDFTWAAEAQKILTRYGID